MRTRFGASLVNAVDLMGEVIKNRKTACLCDISRSKPRGSGRCHYTDFLNPRYPVFVGPEKIAQFAKLPIIYVRMTRVKRGYYEIEYQLLAEPPYEKNKDSYPVTELYARAVESHILQHPDGWFVVKSPLASTQPQHRLVIRHLPL